MSHQPNQVIEDFDFTEALTRSADARMRSSVSLAERQLDDRGVLGLFSIPPIPPCGATDAELDGLRLKAGVPLPDEYARFLALALLDPRRRVSDLGTGSRGG
jgi:hypothetical protein